MVRWEVAVLGLAVLLAGCFGGGNRPQDNAQPSESEGSTGDEPGTESDGALAEPPYTTYNRTGRTMIEVLDVGVDVGGDARLLQISAPGNASGIVAEMEWSAVQGDLDLYLLSPRFCPVEGGFPLDIAMSLACNIRWRATSDSEGAYGADGGTTDPSERYLRVEISAEQVSQASCGPKEEACEWIAYLYPNYAFEAEWDLRVTVFEALPPPEGFTAFEA